MIRFVLRGLRERWRTLALSVLTLALGAALTTAALVLQASAEHAAGTVWLPTAAPVVVAAEPADDRLAATPSAEPARLSGDAVDTLSALPGVRAAVAQAPFAAYVIADGPDGADDAGDADTAGGPGGTVLGGQADRSQGFAWDPGLETERGRGPASAGEAAVDARTAADAGIGVGDRVRVLTDGGVSEATVTGVVAGPPGGRAVFFAATAGPVPEEPRAPTAVALYPDDGVDAAALAAAVTGQVPGVRVLTGADRSTAFTVDRTDRELSTGMGRFFGTTAVLTLAVAAVVTTGLLTTAMRARGREFALLRLAGASPGAVRRIVWGEALALGAAAAVLAPPLGLLGAAALTRAFTATGVLPAGFETVVGPGAVAAGPLVALAASLAAAVRPARAAGRTAPIEAVREAAAEDPDRVRGRVVWGALSLTAAAVLLGLTAATAGTRESVLAASAAAIALVPAAALLVPVGLARALRRLRPRAAVPFLVAREAAAAPRRVTGVLTPLLVTTLVGLLLLLQPPTLAQARAHSYGDRLAADLVVSGPVGVGLPAGTVGAAAAVPGVAAAGGFRQTVVIGERVSAPAHIVTPEAVGDLYRLDPEQGSWDRFDDGGVALSAGLAAAEGWEAGDTAELHGPDGEPVRARVDVVYRAGLDFPDVLLPRAALAERMVDPLESAVHVRLEPGADPAGTARLLREAVADVPGVEVSDRAGHLADLAALAEEDGWITYLMVAVVAGLAGVGAIATLAVSASARGRDFALLRLAGATRGRVAAVVAGEALAVSAAALAAGTAVALVGLAAMAHAFTGGFALPAVPPDRYAAVALLVPAVGLLASLVPALAALRARPLRAAAS
ncbi:ABC transporter permease [Nocardiopsis changdeensis]|uniref:FtsX-like permease family protein n=1 Tax=Nocardiopsis changdeensis TaxID=2831969 RepID=A0ABX8BTK9_9ACTN|nr:MULTISPECIES: FtsX-like permease family protein [Nocardiopsis]QUX24088.1 FtsX-like permease family protein [Nocardiopsis changdeensis]QYX34484.1 ABC transporter permease [Nocardiopsis sp. MT53]